MVNQKITIVMATEKSITNLLNKEKSSIANHLKKLETGGVIQNYFKKKKDSSDYSFYEITKFGEKINLFYFHPFFSSDNRDFFFI